MDKCLATARFVFQVDSEAWKLTNKSILGEIKRLREEIIQLEQVHRKEMEDIIQISRRSAIKAVLETRLRMDQASGDGITGSWDVSEWRNELAETPEN